MHPLSLSPLHLILSMEKGVEDKTVQYTIKIEINYQHITKENGINILNWQQRTPQK